jgi:threonine dehydrogenase-like Zn-dependent dehydrogenase
MPAMQAIRYDLADADFPASLVEIPDPDLPSGEWARVAVTVGGICGSDLHLFSPSGGGSPTLVSIGILPFLLGHEIAGRIIEVGPDCPWSVGSKVAVDPILPCLVRGIEPLCANCSRGWPSSCLELDSRVLTPGRSIGFTDGLGGGWAEQVMAHPSMLHEIPHGVPDRAASLHEPISIALHGLGRRPPDEGSPILIVGGGVIGLAALIAIGALFPDNEVTVLVRHDHQVAAAEACGAAHVVQGSGVSAFEHLAELTVGRTVGSGEDWMLVGGYPYVIEAAGSAGSTTDALRAVENRGTVLLLGAMGTGRVDMTPLWYKEAVMIGSVDHGRDPKASIGQARPGRDHSIDVALDILALRSFPDDMVVTHEFPLSAYRDAVGAGLEKKTSEAIKVVFRPIEDAR